MPRVWRDGGKGTQEKPTGVGGGGARSESWKREVKTHECAAQAGQLVEKHREKEKALGKKSGS